MSFSVNLSINVPTAQNIQNSVGSLHHSLHSSRSFSSSSSKDVQTSPLKQFPRKFSFSRNAPTPIPSSRSTSMSRSTSDTQFSQEKSTQNFRSLSIANFQCFGELPPLAPTPIDGYIQQSPRFSVNSPSPPPLTQAPFAVKLLSASPIKYHEETPKSPLIWDGLIGIIYSEFPDEEGVPEKIKIHRKKLKSLEKADTMKTLRRLLKFTEDERNYLNSSVLDQIYETIDYKNPIAEAAKKNYAKATSFYLSKNVKNADIHLALDYAVENGNIEIVNNLLLHFKRNIHTFSDLLILSSMKGHLQLVNRFIELGAQKYNEAFLEAATHGHTNILERFVEIYTPEENVMDTSIANATKNNHISTIIFLLKYVEQEDKINYVMNFYAKSLEAINIFLSKGAEISAILPETAMKENIIEIVNKFIENGEFINVIFEHAVQNNNEEIVRRTVENVDDVELLTTSMSKAFSNGSQEIINMIFKRLKRERANLYNILNESIIHAIISGHLHIIKNYIKYCNLYVKNKLFIDAVSYGHYDIVAFFLRVGIEKYSIEQALYTFHIRNKKNENIFVKIFKMLIKMTSNVPPKILYYLCSKSCKKYVKYILTIKKFSTYELNMAYNHSLRAKNKGVASYLKKRVIQEKDVRN